MYQPAISVLLGCVCAGVASPPVPSQAEPFDDFVNRWNAWTETIPENQRAGDAMVSVIESIRAEAYQFDELWNQRGYNPGDVLSEAFPWNEFWKHAPEIFEKYRPELDQLHELAQRPYLAGKIAPDPLSIQDEHLPDALIQEYSLKYVSPLRSAAGYLRGHAAYLAFTGHQEEAYQRLLSVAQLSKHAMETPSSLSWASAAGVSIGFQTSIIEMLSYDPDLFRDEHLAGFQAMIIEQIGTKFADTVSFDQWVTEETWRKVYLTSQVSAQDQPLHDHFYKSYDFLQRNFDHYPKSFVTDPREGITIKPLEDQLKLHQLLVDALEHDLMQDPATQQSLRFSQLIEDRLSGDDTHRFFPIISSIINWRMVLGVQNFYDYIARNNLVILGIYRHRLQTGDWPKTLDDIDPALLPYSTTDFYSGKPLGYRYPRKTPSLWIHGIDRHYEGGLFNIKNSEIDMMTWFSIEEWNAMSVEEQIEHCGDFKVWDHPSP
ncbi:MAG: hypothetical protein AB8C13_03275 [Phycisphaerales bacterium]